MYHETEEDVAGIAVKSNLGRLLTTLLVGVTAVVVALTMLHSSWRSSSHDAKPEQVDPLAEYRRQIAALKARQDEAHRLLEALLGDREALIERLKRLRVRSSADLKTVPTARPLAEELAEVVRQIRAQEQKVQQFDVAIMDAESRLRRIERQAAIKVSRTEQERIIRTSVELSEALGTDQSDLLVLEVDEGLDKVLGEPEAIQGKRCR